MQARLIELPQFEDPRGNLTVLEFGDHLPFVPQRCFVIRDVPSTETRGEHAHHQCEQMLVCVAGSCRVPVDDGQEQADFELTGVSSGLYVPPMTWAAQYGYSADAVMLVVASRPYEPEDYIRDYDAFRRLCAERSA